MRSAKIIHTIPVYGVAATPLAGRVPRALKFYTPLDHHAHSALDWVPHCALTQTRLSMVALG